MTLQVLDLFIAVIRDNTIAQSGTAAVLLLIALDVIFGLGNACAHHEYSSTKMREGIGHKASELGFMLVGIVVDATIAAGFDLGFSAPVYVAICAYICLMEIGSLLEIFARINPQLAHSPLFRLLESSKELVGLEAQEGEQDG